MNLESNFVQSFNKTKRTHKLDNSEIHQFNVTDLPDVSSATAETKVRSNLVCACFRYPRHHAVSNDVNHLGHFCQKHGNFISGNSLFQ